MWSHSDKVKIDLKEVFRLEMYLKIIFYGNAKKLRS